MKIEKIRINGFKTFADETVFDLHAGITCIVGPNGCGKSNVVDAFKWAIGEQGTKTLRSKNMEDIIFNGTNTRTQKGMAAVTIYISGMQSEVSTNGDNDNILVTRRLNRSGESEYLINNQKKRLKDIKDLFLDTGLEVNNYSILEQHRISEVIIATPEDRRYLIEEAAGVMKYKVRKAEAASKLERAKINLVRITDITTEVKRSINSLERQVKKAETYKKLINRLGEIEIKAARHDFLEHESISKNLTDEKDKLLSEIQGLTLKYSQFEGQKREISNIIAQKEGIIGTKQGELHKLQGEFASVEREIAIKETEINNINVNIKRFDLQKGEYIQEVTEDSENIKGLTETMEGIERERQLLDEELKSVNTRSNIISDALNSYELILKDKNRLVFKSADGINQVKNEILHIQSAINSLKQKHLHGDSFRELSATEIDDHDKAQGQLQVSIKSALETLYSQKEFVTVTVSQIKDAEVKRDELSRSISSLREDLASNGARLNSLLEITSGELNLEILREHIDILSPISEIIEVSSEYEAAVESALSERIKGFILKDREGLRDAVRFVKAKPLGSSSRTVFISSEFSQAVNHDNEAGVEGEIDKLGVPLYHLVKAPQQFYDIIKSLFYGYFLVPDIDTALDYQKNFLSQKKGIPRTFVTMDGDIIERSGAVITGRQSRLLGYFREIKSLKESIPRLNIRIDKEQVIVGELTQEIDKLKEILKGSEDKVLKSEREISTFKHEIERHNEEKERILKRIRLLKLESEQVNKEIDLLLIDLASKEALLMRLSTEKQLLDKEIQDIRDNMTQGKADIENIRLSLNEKTLSLERKKERLKGIKNEKAVVEKKVFTVKAKIESIDKEILTLIERDKVYHKDIEILNLRNQELKGKAQSINDDIAVLREALNIDIISLQEIEKGINPIREQLDGFKDKVREIEVQLTEHRLKTEGIAENIRNNYGKEIALIEAEALLEDERQQMPILRQKIQSIGPVNLASISEYEELTKRHDFLTSQRDDVSKSIEELTEAIDKINSTTKIRLRDAFNKLNVTFNDTFKTLFGGGRAEIRLTDNNILEAGLDIVVQPPGKKLQGLNLLSGGEKTLTALSLIFAGFLVKPQPLCILDEADAALDESNSARFSNMVKSLSSKTQFIMITHNRLVMEAADYIYGITSEEAGVSKILSMQLVEN